MLIASDIGGQYGLGTFQEGPVSGGCDAGKDYICGPRGGIFSCRPCDYSQLAAFKALQKKANQLVVALGMTKKPAIITGRYGCTGGDILAIDGRVGPCTRRTVAAIVEKFGPALMGSTDPRLSSTQFKSTYEYIAYVVPELNAYFSHLITLSNAPRNVPAPAQQPIKRTNAPGSVPQPEPDRRTVVFKEPARAGLTLGIFGALAAVGLVGAGVMHYKSVNA